MANLEEIKARRAAITNPPWKAAPRSSWVEQRDPWPTGYEHRPTVIAYCHMTRGHAQSEWRNAQFIAHAPTDIDWLITRVEERNEDVKYLGVKLWEAEEEIKRLSALKDEISQEADRATAELGATIAGLNAKVSRLQKQPNS